MDIKYWIYILDEPDTFSVVDMIEHTGTAYLPQLDEMKQGDIVFIATLDRSQHKLSSPHRSHNE